MSHRPIISLDLAKNIHMCISIPPQYAVSNVVGYLKGKSAISKLENLKAVREIIPVRIFGQEVTSYPR